MFFRSDEPGTKAIRAPSPCIEPLSNHAVTPRRHCEPPLGGVAIHPAQQDLKQAKRFFLKKEAKTSILKANGGNARLSALSTPRPKIITQS
jgi:hypothetical protein